jgi:TonB family protein
LKPVSGSWSMQLTYDGNGNVSEETLHILDGLSTWRYQYELDEKGNWIKRTKLSLVNEKGPMRFEPVEIAYRTITYHHTTESSHTISPFSLAAIVAEEEMSSYLPGEAIKRTEPAYPEQARRMGMRGAIVFAAMADEKGEVVSVRAFPLGHEPLRNAAEAAAWHWKFNPIVSGGYSVRRVVAYTFNFNL